MKWSENSHIGCRHSKNINKKSYKPQKEDLLLSTT